MGVIKVPSLSTDKFIHEPLLKLDTLYTYFLASEFSQTNVYRGNISSLKYIFSNNSDNNKSLISDVDRSLTNFLERYFKEVDVYVDYDEDNNEIKVNIKVKEVNGDEATLGNTLSIADGKVDTYSAISDILRK